MVDFELVQTSGVPIPKKWLKVLLKKASQELKLKNKEVSVAIVGETAIKQLNTTYRKRNKVTDVLSFSERDVNKKELIAGGYLGEIVICYPQAKRQAKKYGHSFKKEFSLLFIHGFLHLLGYNHEKSKDAEVMEALEEKILGYRPR